jgi:thioredoxin-like negative regulator of GroEL
MYTLNVDENKEFSMQLGVRAIPTIKSFNEGKTVETKVGVLQEYQLKELVNGLLNG